MTRNYRFQAIPIIFLLLFYFTSAGQSDSIALKSGIKFPCQISAVSHAAIEYKDLSGNNRFIDLFKVAYYVKNNQRFVGKSRVGLDLTSQTDSVNISEEIAYMRYCMQKFHSQYTTGLSLSLVGSALMASTLFLGKENPFKQEIGLGGAVIGLVGFGITIDAHKWFLKASWGVGGKGGRVTTSYRMH